LVFGSWPEHIDPKGAFGNGQNTINSLGCSFLGRVNPVPKEKASDGLKGAFGCWLLALGQNTSSGKVPLANGQNTINSLGCSFLGRVNPVPEENV
jgi:hypothetical protein